MIPLLALRTDCTPNKLSLKLMACLQLYLTQKGGRKESYTVLCGRSFMMLLE